MEREGPPVERNTALTDSLGALIQESQRLRVDVHEAEAARRKANLLNMAVLGLLVLVVLLFGAVTVQNNMLGAEVKKGNARIVDCTTPGGQCYRDSGARTGKAIADIVRSQVYVAECARLLPGASGPAFDAAIEQCVSDKLANQAPLPPPSRTPAPTPVPTAPQTPLPSPS